MLIKLIRIGADLFTPRVLVLLLLSAALAMTLRFVYIRGYDNGVAHATTEADKHLRVVTHQLSNEIARARQFEAESQRLQNETFRKLSSQVRRMETRLMGVASTYENFIYHTRTIVDSVDFKCDIPPKLVQSLRKANRLLQAGGDSATGSGEAASTSTSTSKMPDSSSSRP